MRLKKELVVERFTIDILTWRKKGFYCGVDRNTLKLAMFDSNNNIANITGFLNFGTRKCWFLKGYICSALEIFETLTEEEKGEAVWELDQWK